MNKYEEYTIAITQAVNTAVLLASDLQLDIEDVHAIYQDACWYVENGMGPSVNEVLSAYAHLPEYEDVKRIFGYFFGSALTAKQGIDLGYLPKSYKVGVELFSNNYL